MMQIIAWLEMAFWATVLAIPVIIGISLVIALVFVLVYLIWEMIFW